MYKKKHFTLKGHIISREANHFPCGFGETIFEVIYTQEKNGLHSVLEREWLMISLVSNKLDRENKPILETIRISTRYLSSFIQALVLASYCRETQVEFPENFELIAKDAQGKANKCNRLTVSCFGSALGFDIIQNDVLVKSIMFKSGSTALEDMLETLEHLEVSLTTREEWRTLLEGKPIKIIDGLMQ